MAHHIDRVAPGVPESTKYIENSMVGTGSDDKSITRSLGSVQPKKVVRLAYKVQVKKGAPPGTKINPTATVLSEKRETVEAGGAGGSEPASDLKQTTCPPEYPTCPPLICAYQKVFGPIAKALVSVKDGCPLPAVDVREGGLLGRRSSAPVRCGPS